MYELPQSLLVANPINRYLINSPMLPSLVNDPDGGLHALPPERVAGHRQGGQLAARAEGPVPGGAAAVLAETRRAERGLEGAATGEGLARLPDSDACRSSLAPDEGQAMAKYLTDLELIHELEPVAEAGLNQHLASTKNWNPHDYVPWSEGTNYGLLGGRDWDADQSRLSELARIAMITNLLTEDNLPSYHRAIAEYFTHRRRLGRVGRPLDGRGEPARHRAAGLPRRHQGRGSGCAWNRPGCCR